MERLSFHCLLFLGNDYIFRNMSIFFCKITQKLSTYFSKRHSVMNPKSFVFCFWGSLY